MSLLPRSRTGRSGGVLAAVVALCWVLLPGTASAAPVSGGPVAAGFSATRNCKSIQTGDLIRKLDVCTLSYAYPLTPLANDYRFVVQLHSYRWAGQAGWLDSTSQSLTVNRTEVQNAYSAPEFEFGGYHGWGNDVGGNLCRHGSPDGPIGCSVPNAVRVDFFSKRFNYTIEANTLRWRNVVFNVSWRDDRGQAHYWAPNLDSPTVYNTMF